MKIANPIPPSTRSGQVMVFFMMVVVVLVFVAFWNFDLQKIIRVKGITQDGGDAAALMAARWQAISLNLAGDLNLMQAIALSAGDTATLDAIGRLQDRLRFTGPMTGMLAAQQAAKNNRLLVNPEFTQFLREHAVRVAEVYPYAIGLDGEMLFPEPWPGAWADYSRMIARVADDGVAAAPDNIRFYDDPDAGDHMLYNIGFYEAVGGRNWCWFHFNAPGLLDAYRNFFPAWWPPLPDPPRAAPVNSEIFGLHLARRSAPLAVFNIPVTLQDALATERGLTGSVTPNAWTSTVTWVVYGSAWGRWSAAATEGEDPFPFAGPVREAYDYAGSDASIRVEATAGRVTPGAGGTTVSNTLTWTAAAKPFGMLASDQRPNAFSLVLPAFRDVRLIPVDASSAPEAGGFNLGWRRHIEHHLPDYMENGPFATPAACGYCQQLRTWENETFRRTGSEWLRLFSNQCRPPGGIGSGGGSGGGRRRGH